MNKKNILNKGYLANENILKKIVPSNHSENNYSSFFNSEKDTSSNMKYAINSKQKNISSK